MQLRWTEQADLEAITNYLLENAPCGAHCGTLYNAPPSLLEFPYRGRPGRKEGTRDLVLLPLPYVIVYNVAADTIHILPILHAAQSWP